jgi:D-alanyl-D-alanine carboxypeptidase
MAAGEAYRARIDALLASLQLPGDLLEKRALELQPEAEELVVAEVGHDGREHRLIPAAADAWRAMRAAARADGVELRIVSAFRSVERQVEILRAKLESGQTPGQILTVSAPPGYSEHHTGRAVDVATDTTTPLEEVFEQTEAFRWMTRRANEFSFFLSYPRGNASGYAYEPWHWCYRSETA